MPDGIVYRAMADGEEDGVFNLVKAGFDEYIRPDVTEDGAKEFFRAAREMIYDRPAAHFILVAESGGAVSGMIAVRKDGHICLFFVMEKFQQKGTGRGLLEQAIARCIAEDPDISGLGVNSSLYAVPIYERLGFRKAGPEQFKNGIRFFPLIKSFRKRDL